MKFCYIAYTSKFKYVKHPSTPIMPKLFLDKLL